MPADLLQLSDLSAAPNFNVGVLGFLDFVYEIVLVCFLRHNQFTGAKDARRGSAMRRRQHKGNYIKLYKSMGQCGSCIRRFTPSGYDPIHSHSSIEGHGLKFGKTRVSNLAKKFYGFVGYA